MKLWIVGIAAGCLLLAGLIGAGISAQGGFTGAQAQATTQATAQSGGFTGPGATPQQVRAADVRNMRDDTRVTLEGQIVRALGDEKYMFRDESGEVVVEIDDEYWRGLSVGENDRVRITGEVDVEGAGRRRYVDVKSIEIVQR